MRKVIGIITVLCFFISNVGFALSPPLAFDDIADGTADKKNIALAKIGLLLQLERLENLSDIEGTTDEETIKDAFHKAGRIRKRISYTENTIDKPAKVTAYFYEVKHIGAHIFEIPVAVRERTTDREDYRLLFSTIKKDGVFPVTFCTKKQLEELKDKIIQKDQLPTLTKKNVRDIERYIEHERSSKGKVSVDDWIRDKIEKGEYAVSERTYYLHSDHLHDYHYVKFLFSDDEQKKLTIQTLKLAKTLGVNNSALFDLETTLPEDKPLVIIYRHPGEKLPEVTMLSEDGAREISVPVRGHSSDLAIYHILDLEDFKTMAPKRADFVGSKDIASRLHRKQISIKLAKGSEKCKNTIEKLNFYEVTTHLGLEGKVKKNRETTNLLTRAREDYEKDPASYKPIKEISSLQVVKFSDSLGTRDYAGGVAETEIPVVINDIELKAPIINGSLKETLKSLALNPDVLLTKIDGKSSVLVNGKTPASDKLKRKDEVTINYRSPLYFLRREGSPNGQHLYRDNYPENALQIEVLHAIAGQMGITTNLSIFQKAAATGRFNEAIRKLVKLGITDTEEVYDRVTMPAFQEYANLIGELTLTSGYMKGVLGSASYEVPPQFIHDTQATAIYQQEIIALNPSTVMIKTPSTAAGFEAIRQNASLEDILRNNLTLMFGFDQWVESQLAEIEVLEERVEKGLPIDSHFGVDSFFLTRIEILINTIFKKLRKKGTLFRSDEIAFDEIKDLVAVAAAKIVGRWNNYVYFGKTRPGGRPYSRKLDELKERFKKIRRKAIDKGLGDIRPRVPLWASTQVKKPDLARGIDPLLYFVNLIGPNTVNTMPDGLINAIEERFIGMTDAEKENAIKKLDNAIDNDRIIVHYNPKGKSKYASKDLTPAKIINLVNALLEVYTEQITNLKGTYPSIKDSELEKEIKGNLPSIKDLDIKTEIEHYNKRLSELVKKGILSRDLYEKEKIDTSQDFRLNMNVIAKILTWRGGYLFEDAYKGSLGTFAEKVNEAKEALEEMQSDVVTKDSAKPEDISEAGLLREALKALPEAYKSNPINHGDLLTGMQKAGIREVTHLDENTCLIFSKELTFDLGVGALLAKPAQAGISIAVIAETPEQKEAVEKFNELEGLPIGKGILVADSVMEAWSLLNQRAAKIRNGKGIQNFYYFKTKQEEDPNVGGVKTITLLVEKIVRALREATRTVSESLERFNEARRLFKEAA